ncbi:hypothetical protein VDG1235_2090 [Verrucomicrobiia bacterium DG1235]|nr:hypothetical protein VDG1235_2090 [Verrucomicrobiae bacterium DG1235]
MNVLYIDDEKEAAKKFASDFALFEDVSVSLMTKANDVSRKLIQRKKTDLPDIIVIDLYAKTDPSITEDRVDELIEEIEKKRLELKEEVKKMRTPVGVAALKQLKITHKTKKIPVILRTREGLALLQDSVLSETNKLGAQWTLKGRGAEFELNLMQKVFDDSEEDKNKASREVKLTAWGALGGAVVGFALTLVTAFLTK